MVLTQVNSTLTVTTRAEDGLEIFKSMYTIILATSNYSWLKGIKYVTQLILK